MSKYNRTIAELEVNAVKFWPQELVEQEAESSIIPLLIKTQDKFISVIILAEAGPDAWKQALPLQSGNDLTPNLFLKHLQVLTDFGGEQLQRLNFIEIFPQGTMTYVWREKTYTYKFKAILDGKKTNNPSLHIDGKGLIKPCLLEGRMEDIAMVLLHGATSTDLKVPDHVKEKCVIGSLIGESDQLNKFVKERYIWVSRITGGATANSLGQIAQAYVRERLTKLLPGWSFVSTIPGISQNAGDTDTSFDTVAKSPSGKYTAIEVSFQVTTNSVIERKSGQAQARYDLLHKHGHRIAYVIDGAGNFQRSTAVGNLCKFSDCTVAFSDAELGVLAQFLRDFEKGLA
jgi:hypothetical protein